MNALHSERLAHGSPNGFTSSSAETFTGALGGLTAETFAGALAGPRPINEAAALPRAMPAPISIRLLVVMLLAMLWSGPKAEALSGNATNSRRLINFPQGKDVTITNVGPQVVYRGWVAPGQRAPNSGHVRERSLGWTARTQTDPIKAMTWRRARLLWRQRDPFGIPEMVSGAQSWQKAYGPGRQRLEMTTDVRE